MRQAGLLVAIFCMVAWLQISSLTRDTNPENRGTRDLLLSAINISIGSIGLLLLLATSTQDLSLASAVVPVRLMIIVVLSWFNIGLQARSRSHRGHRRCRRRCGHCGTLRVAAATAIAAAAATTAPSATAIATPPLYPPVS
jgi:ribose/xylose/arabinose/galactoside ABC-type transport system permease subunit